MSLRSSIFEKVNIGFEPTTASSGVACPWQLSQSLLTLSPQINTEDLMEQGGKGDVDIVINKEMTTAAVEGIISIPDVLFWISSVVAIPASSGSPHISTINQNDFDDKRSFTLEMGSTQGTCKVINAQGKGMTITLNEETAPRYSVDLIAKAIQDGITMTSGATKVSTSAVGAKGVSVFIATAASGLAVDANKLTDAFLLEASLRIENVISEIFGIEDVSSYSDTVDTKPVIQLSMSVEQNATANQWMTYLRAGTLLFARVKLYRDASNYIYIDFPFRFKDPGRKDTRGVYSGTYVAHANYDSAFGTMCKITVAETTLTNGMRTDLVL